MYKLHILKPCDWISFGRYVTIIVVSVVSAALTSSVSVS
jgi:hypothetical protein